MNQKTAAQQEEEIRPDSHSRRVSSGLCSESNSNSTLDPKSASTVLSSQDLDSLHVTSLDVSHAIFTSKDSNKRDLKCDQSTVEKTLDWLCILMFVSGVILAVLSNFVPDYNRTFAVLLTTEYCIRLIRKCCREGLNRLLDDYNIGALGLFLAMRTASHERVISIVNISYVGCRVIVYAIQVLPYSMQLLIGRIFVKFLRVKNKRDRYEYLGLPGLLPSNEAVNMIVETATDGWYYSLKSTRNHLSKPCNEAVNKITESISEGRCNSSERIDAETCPDDVEAHRKLAWKIGTMIVSYSDNRKWVTIRQKAEDRAVKTYMDPFTGEQKSKFIQMMNAWEERPEQGILEKVVGGRTNWYCLTLAQLIDLTKQGYSVCKVLTDVSRIEVGAPVDAVVEDYIDGIRKRVHRLGMDSISEKGFRCRMQVYACVVVISSVVALTRLWDAN